MIKFDAVMAPHRFWYIIPKLKEAGIFNSFREDGAWGGIKPRKTACLYGENLNVYIDASDGHAVEWGTIEPCERVLWIVEDTKDKPFLFFKNWYSPSMCIETDKIVSENNGRTIPFMYWGTYPYFPSIWQSRNELMEINKSTEKIIDVGLYAKPRKYYDPNRSKFDSRMSWMGYEWFGYGPAVDTGMNEHSARIEIINKVKQSKYTYDHIYDVPMETLISRSMNTKVVYDMPTTSSISHRMFEFGWFGKCVILRTSDVDFPYSWKEYYPELDYNSDTWEDDLGEIIENHEEWGDKIKYYLETYCTPEVITDYFLKEIEKELDK